MKKILALILSLCLMVTLVACNRTPSESDPAPDNNASGSSSEELIDTPDPTPDEEPPADEGDGPADHTHTYANATCTKAATCSCGATKGSALGHNWQAATCKAPKTCKTCGATEGGTGSHAYANGTCTVCGATTALNPKNNLSTDEYIGNLRESGGMLYGSALMFDGEYCVLIDRQFTAEPNDPDQTPITFNGNTYYSLGGGMDPQTFTTSDTDITVTLNTGKTMKLIVQQNRTLKITASNVPNYPVGTVLSTNINDVLR